jgi:hypothetical protein
MAQILPVLHHKLSGLQTGLAQFYFRENTGALAKLAAFLGMHECF